MADRAPCDQWIIRLSAHLDREEPNPAEVEAHLAECEACRQWYDAVRQDGEMVRKAYEITPSAEFVSGVMGAVRASAPASDGSPLSRKPRGPRALTRGQRMVELVAAAAVIVLLVGVLSPVVGVLRGAWGGGECINNIRNISVATRAYAIDNGNTLPPSMDWDSRLGSYVTSVSVFQCPDSLVLPSYHYRPELSFQTLGSFPDPANTLVLYEQCDSKEGVFEPRHGGNGSTAYLDGRARMVPELPNDLLIRVGEAGG